MYKVGRAPVHWVTMVRESLDDGKTWLPERPLVANDTRLGRGPVKNKPIRLTSGRILAPASTELQEWEAFVDISDDDGVTWHKSNIIRAADLLGFDNYAIGVIQPSSLAGRAGEVHMLLRSTEGHIYKSDSKDNGTTWCAAYPLNIPNNNSGLDLVRSQNGILYLVCNPITKSTFGKSRSPLTLLFSRDNGITWTKMLDLETGKGEYSYPAIIERDGDVYISYTWQRRNIAFRHFTRVQLAKYRMAATESY
jgi:Neuraminidase (sialidase)